jgi:hypothetical protein
MALLASPNVGIRGPALLINRVAKLYAVGVRRRALLVDFSVLVARSLARRRIKFQLTSVCLRNLKCLGRGNALRPLDLIPIASRELALYFGRER